VRLNLATLAAGIIAKTAVGTAFSQAAPIELHLATGIAANCAALNTATAATLSDWGDTRLAICVVVRAAAWAASSPVTAAAVNKATLAAGIVAKRALGTAFSQAALIEPHLAVGIAASCVALRAATAVALKDCGDARTASCATVRAAAWIASSPVTAALENLTTPTVAVAGIAVNAEADSAFSQVALIQFQPVVMNGICVAVKPEMAAGSSQSACAIELTCAVVSDAICAAVALW